MVLTFYTFFYQQNPLQILAAVRQILMTVALAYKLVLVLIGIGIMVFWHNSLRSYLGHYYFLYLIGIGLNILLVMVIGAVMLCPEIIRHIALTIDNLLVRFGILKANTTRLGQVEQFIENYRCAGQ